MSQNASLEGSGMRFAGGSVDISTASLASEAQLREELARREPASEFLNPDVGGAKHYYLIEIRGPGNDTSKGAIGIASEGHGWAPQVAFNSRTDSRSPLRKSISLPDELVGGSTWNRCLCSFLHYRTVGSSFWRKSAHESLTRRSRAMACSEMHRRAMGTGAGLRRGAVYGHGKLPRSAC